jgi:hypothetical protein
MSTYNVYARLNLEVSVEIQAQSLEEALEQARKLKEVDFVDIPGEFLDGNMQITGVLAA